MSKRRAFVLGGLVLLLLGAEYAILSRLLRQSGFARVETRVTNGGLPLAPGDVRVFLQHSGGPGEVVAEGDARKALRVPPGRYDLRVLLAPSRDHQTLWFRDIELAEGERIVKQAEFSSGQLSFESVVGSSEAAAGQVVAYVFSPQDHDQIITSMRSREIAVLSAGSYDLRVVFTVQSEEKGVQWLRDVPVEVGGHTRRQVTFRHGALLVAAHNAGEEIPHGAVALTVYAAGDEQEEVVDSGLAGVPMSLERGRYDVKATFTDSNDRPSRWLRSLEIVEDETLEETIVFSSGTFLVDAEMVGGTQLLGFQVYVYYYAAGNHQQPVAYEPAGAPAVLESGRYDLRVHFFRSHDRPDIWVRGIDLEAGQIVRQSVVFPSGRLLVRAYDAAGAELIGDDVFLYVYAARQRSRPIVVARSGEELILTEGAYDLRLLDTRRPASEEWLDDVVVSAGDRKELSANLRTGDH